MKTISSSLVAGLMLAAALTITGCATTKNNPVPAGMDKPHVESVTLREGDTVKVAFAGNPNLDTTQQIRRDGKISLKLVDDVDAKGLTPDELQKKLIDLYASQISSKEITVTLQSSTFDVFVSGQVIHPGKVQTDHPLTALEAIMEAGGYDPHSANMRAVSIHRTEDGKMKTYKINLQDLLDGKTDKLFYLEQGDIVNVPERFQMF